MIKGEMAKERSCFDWGNRAAKSLGEIDLVEAFIEKLKRFSRMNSEARYMYEAAERGAETALVDIVNGVLTDDADNFSPDELSASVFNPNYDITPETKKPNFIHFI